MVKKSAQRTRRNHNPAFKDRVALAEDAAWCNRASTHACDTTVMLKANFSGPTTC